MHSCLILVHNITSHFRRAVEKGTRTASLSFAVQGGNPPGAPRWALAKDGKSWKVYRLEMAWACISTDNLKVQAISDLRHPAPAGNLQLSPSSFKGKRRSLKPSILRNFKHLFFLRAEATGFWVLTVKVFVLTTSQEVCWFRLLVQLRSPETHTDKSFRFASQAWQAWNSDESSRAWEEGENTS